MSDIYDKLWSLDSSSTRIQFLAADLARVPREKENSDSLASIEQLLASIHSLKTTVSLLQFKMVTREQLDASLSTIVSINSTNNSSGGGVGGGGGVGYGGVGFVASSSETVSLLPPPLSPSAPALSQSPEFSFATAVQQQPQQQQQSETSTLPESSNMQHKQQQQHQSNTPSAFITTLNKKQQAEVVSRQRGKTAGKMNAQPVKRDRNSSILIGKNVNTGVISWKGADLTVARYVGRVAFGTPASDIQESLKSRGVDVVSLDAVTTKHDRFASFKLVIKKSQLELIQKDDFWPDGVIVGRWWSAKSTTATSATVSNSQPPTIAAASALANDVS